MRNLLVIGLIAIHLFGNTELNQLFRIPNLVSHYFQHHRQDPGISFLEFLTMHYGGDDGTHSDDNEDRKLPCHNGTGHSLSPSYTGLPKTSFISAELNFDGKKVYGGRVLAGKPSGHVMIILQPPRLS